MRRLHLVLLLAQSIRAAGAMAQEPASWGDELVFHTFSIAAVDPATGESGVAVTTRVACVGNGVPWVRSGVGAVATQASTRVEYGVELLAFRTDQGLSTSLSGSLPGLVDADTVTRLWAALDESDLANEVRRQLLDATRIRR